MKKLTLACILAVCILFLFGCELKHDEDTSADITIYTSIYPLQYATEEIVGTMAQVKTVYPPGVDAHHYEPAAKDITAIATADTFIMIGGTTESFASAIQSALARQPVHMITLSEHEELFHRPGDESVKKHSHDHDPHIWLDPLRMIEIGTIIKEELMEQFPKHKTLFAKNYAQFKHKMMQLDNTFTEQLDSEKPVHIIVTHAAYDYWEDRYNIVQIPIRGRSNSDEPSQKDLIDVVHMAETYEIEHVFFEQNSNDYVSTIIVDHIGGEKLQLHNLEVRTEQDIANGDHYISLMEQNLHALLKAVDKDGRSHDEKHH